MVSVVAPRPTRFRYPVKVSGPADEGSAQEWVGWRAGGGSSGCYLGLVHISTVESRVKMKVEATVKVEASKGNEKRAGAAETRLTSQAWTESVPDPVDAWNSGKKDEGGLVCRLRSLCSI